MSQWAEPIPYASASLDRRPLLVTTVAIVSICVASLSLIINGIFEISSFRGLLSALNPPLVFPVFRLAPQPHWPISIGHWRSLTAGEISNVIREANSQLRIAGGPPLNDKQTQTLTKLLSSPDQPFIDPALGLNVVYNGSLQIFRAMPGNAGEVMLSVRHGDVYDLHRTRIEADGSLLRLAYSAAARAILRVAPIPASPPGFYSSQMQVFHDQYVSAAYSSIAFGAYILLAILLLWAAILLLFSRIKGVRLHWSFVWLKLALVLITASEIPTDFLGIQYHHVFPLGDPIICVGCLYPMILVFLLRSKSVRFGNPDAEDPNGLCHFIGCASIAVACLGFLITVVFEKGALDEMTLSQTNRAAELRNLADEAARRAANVGQTSFIPPSLSADSKARYDAQYRAGLVGALVFPLDFATAIILQRGRLASYPA